MDSNYNFNITSTGLNDILADDITVNSNSITYGPSYIYNNLTISGVLNATTVKENGVQIDTLIFNALSSYTTLSGLLNYVTISSMVYNLSYYDTTNIINNKLSSYQTISSSVYNLSYYDTTNVVNTKLASYQTISSYVYNLSYYDTTNIINNKLASYQTISSSVYNLSYYDTTNRINTKLSSYTPLFGATISGNIFYSTSNMYINGNTVDTVQARNTSLLSYVLLAGSQTISGSLIINGPVSLGSTLSITSDTTCNAKLNITGNTTCNSALTVAGIIAGNGSNITSLNASNISSGTLAVAQGGTGTNSLTSNQILFGNGTSAISQNSKLYWDPVYSVLNSTNGVSVSNGYAYQFNYGSGLGKGTYSTSASTNDLVLRADPAQKLILQSGIGAAGMIIDSINNIIIYNKQGIGTTNPQYPLDVSGNLNATEFYRNNVALPTYLSSLYPKRTGFKFSTSTSITLNSNTYYKYDIDLRLYTNTYTFGPYSGYSYPQRKFKIMTFFESGYFDISPSYTLSYEISMGNPPIDAYYGGIYGYAGLNLVAIGVPENYSLKNISNSGTSQFLLRNTFNYLTYISQVPNTSVVCIIEDYF